MRSSIVLIDFENVQPESLELLVPDHFRVLLFVGASQTKLPFDIVASIQQLGTRAEYVKIFGNGPNALDFHISYYIGVLSVRDPSAHFYIVSKDTGFDPLIRHLKSQKILAQRVNTVSEVSTQKVAGTKLPIDRVQFVVDRLTPPKSGKPKTVKTLTSSIASFFQKQLSEDEVSAIVKGLVKRGFITIKDTKVTYSLNKTV